MKLIYGVFLAPVLFFLSCSDNNNPVIQDPLPPVLIDETFNLNNQEFLDLNIIGNTVTLDNYGSRGIIIYRASEREYRVFERHSPYRYQEDCAVVDVDDSNLFMIERCDGVNYDFFGEPISGNATLPLRRYPAVLDGNFLIVQN